MRDKFILNVFLELVVFRSEPAAYPACLQTGTRYCPRIGDGDSKMIKAILLAGGVSVFALPQGAFAWGDKGHETIALIAAKEIRSPDVKAKIAKLLGVEDAASGMQTAAPWADKTKTPATAPWHFTDIEIDDAGYQPARDCKDDQCSVAQIEKHIAILKNPSSPEADRTKALKYLIHLIGDVHQPLHSSDNHDRGGNDDTVKSIDGCKEFHAVWDKAMVDDLMTELKLPRSASKSSAEISAHDSKLIADALDKKITDADRTAWRSGKAADWANETFKLAKTKVYPAVAGDGKGKPAITLPTDYRKTNAPIAEEQLERAGVRLAMVLEDALK